MEANKQKSKVIWIIAAAAAVLAVAALVFFLFFYKNKNVRNTEAAISSIGQVTISSEKAIADAEKQYEALTEREKDKISNYQVLKDARSEFTEICDKDAASKVDSLIDAIGAVERSSETVINKARAAYEALTAKQKKYVEKLDVLEKAEKDFEVLDVKECEALISAIGDAVDSPELKLPIALTAARTAYDNLSSSHKQMVTNYANLEAAEEAYDEYKNQKNALKIKQEHEQRLADREKYMDSCQAVTYAQLISNPDTYEGKDISIKVEVLSVEADKFLKAGAILAKPAGGNNDNVISLVDSRDTKEPEFTAKTTVTVYGTFNGVNKITNYVKGSGLFGTDLFAEADSETMVPEIEVNFTSVDDTEAIDEKPTKTEIFNSVEEGLEIAKDVTDILKNIPW